MEESDKYKTPITSELLSNLDKISYLLDKDYLRDLNSGYVPIDYNAYNECNGVGKPLKIGYGNNIRAIKVNRWVYDKEERISDRFKNILNVFSGNDSHLGLVISRTTDGTDMYFVVKNETISNSRYEDSKNNMLLLEKAIKGNFNGTHTEVLSSENNPFTFFEDSKSIACLTNISSEKSTGFISQGLEKLLDGIVPNNENEHYAILILAEPITHGSLKEKQTGYEELASAITPFAQYQYSAGETDTQTRGTIDSVSDSKGINHSITKTNSVNVGVSVQIPAGGVAISPSVGYSHSRSKTEGSSSIHTNTKGNSYNISIGKSENSTYTYKSYSIANLLELLQTQLNRINNGRALGMWKCASYVIAQDAKTSKNVASFLMSLTQGDASFVEAPVINEWGYTEKSNENQTSDFDNIRSFISHFTHPIFANRNDLAANEYTYDPEADEDKVAFITPTCNVTTSELADTMSFPHNPVLGLPVLECMRFGRDVVTFDHYLGNIDIGCTFHMHQKENNKRIKLDTNSLASHTFITGSTGSGKSNTIYKLLENLAHEQVKFLVIEPAKGEYKSVFGGRQDVSVYGTNPNKTPLLRLNPFSFPEDIHVLEHIDRLVEIFNACWPMYAAMPAILKDAVEMAFINKGWSLTKSICNPRRFPTFYDLIEELPKVIESSAYSADTKGDYTGALITRIKSLTNGINGQILCSSSEISNEQLFDTNTIVDISRVGSMETKSLLMGILIMKLQEYRMSCGERNADLKHITVLEEAHHLLRRTSSEQSQASSNLQGKSVEMIANAIAEMRTYGEGFIIADQSPGLMDISVIRNTNTKIIMRLPDESDRKLVGKAAALNDNQIAELSKLMCGVAAIYQNNWLEPVLCAVDKFDHTHTFVFSDASRLHSEITQRFFSKMLNTSDNDEFTEEEIEKIKVWVDSLNVGKNTKRMMYKVTDNSDLTLKEQETVLYNVFDGKRLASFLGQADDRDSSALSNMDNEIKKMYFIDDDALVESIRRIILNIVIEITQSHEIKSKIEHLSQLRGATI